VVTTLVLGMLPAALGLAVLLLPSRSAHLGPARALAVGAALAVVGGELMPSGVDALGPVALLIVAVGVALPRAVDRALARMQARAGAGGFELGFAALVAHQVSDGLQMGVARTLGPGVVLAIAAHGAPLVAAATLASARVRGGGRAAARGAVLVAATGVGVLACGLVDEARLAAAAPVVGVALAGLLVHAVTHGLADDPPRDTADRAVETAAFLLGIGGTLGLLHGVYAGDGHHGHDHPGFAAALLALAGAGGLALAGALTLDRLGLRPRGGTVDVLLGGLLLGPVAGAAQALVAGVASRAATGGRPSSPLHASPWLVVGILAGACAAAFVHPADLTGASGLAAATTVVGVPSVAILPLLGLVAPAHPVLATGTAVLLSAFRRGDGEDPPLAGLVAGALLALAAGPLAALAATPAPVPLHGAAPIGAGLLGLLVAWDLVDAGPRAWLARLLPHPHDHVGHGPILAPSPPA
jgi:ZIP family zinc transporter